MSYLTHTVVSLSDLVYVTHAHVSMEKKKQWMKCVGLHCCICIDDSVCMHERHIGTQVRSSSSVLILRVLTVSIEISRRLKEERKIGK